MLAASRYHDKMSSRARNKFTVRQVAAITEPGIYSDGGGLYMRVRSSGRSWFYIGTLHGKRIELGLGSVLDVTLAKARDKAAELRSMILDGKDPRQERVRARTKQAQATSFGAFAKALVADIEDGFKNPKHRQQWRNTLDTYAKPMADIPIDQVSTQDVLAVLQPIWLSKPETASRVRGRIERVLDAAKVRGLRTGDNPARGRGHLDLLLPKRNRAAVKHHAALPFAEVAAFLTELRGRPATAARALEFTILTAARSGETRGMIWAEVDLPKQLWTVPARRMKAGAAHEVPLSDAALSILTACKEDGLESADFVLSTPA